MGFLARSKNNKVNADADTGQLKANDGTKKTLKQQFDEAKSIKDIPFSAKECKAIQGRYKSLAQKDSFCELHDILLMPELAFNPYVEHVLALIHQEIEGEILFGGEGKDSTQSTIQHNAPQRVSYNLLLRTLVFFHSSTSRKEKIQMAFNVMDVDRDGFISVADMTSIRSEVFIKVGTDIVRDTSHQIIQQILASQKNAAGNIAVPSHSNVCDTDGSVNDIPEISRSMNAHGNGSIGVGDDDEGHGALPATNTHSASKANEPTISKEEFEDSLDSASITKYFTIYYA